jgi:carnitine O-acetyltransferase
MSPARAIPSIDEQLAKASQRKDSVTMGERSEANAKDTTQSFSKDKLNPLMSHTNPKSKPGVTFAAQDKLPKLPIPDLESTCKKYLAALDPLQTAREHADSERAVAEFLRTDGPELQEKLKQYASSKSSYIEQFCWS